CARDGLQNAMDYW
nr:immunoglobulin heavy chain junction region [Mus musculus]